MKQFTLLLGSILSLTCVPIASAATGETVLYTFTGTDGANPEGSLAIDIAGNLFGTTSQGGKYNAGTVFELKAEKDGSRKEKVLHVFTGGYYGNDPYSGLILDTKGNLYGTTIYGGGGGCNGGCGVVFKLTPKPHGKWKETVIHLFHGIDGANPYGTLIFDSLGNLYGTTQNGGHFGRGAVFMLTHISGHSSWGETILHSFNGVDDGTSPTAGLVFDTEGSLYGATTLGPDGGGTVFRLANSRGKWHETVLHSFNDGPCIGGVALDSAGNVYGTTNGIEGFSFGQVFELIPSKGTWKKAAIFTFCNPTCDGGAFPYAALITDKAGNLYGTSAGGNNVSGAVYKLTPSKSGWHLTSLHSFTGGNDGIAPIASLISDAAGNLYGTTLAGGNDLCQYSEGCGIVFQVSP